MSQWTGAVKRIGLVSIAGLALAGVFAGCADETPAPDGSSDREEMFPPETPSEDPGYSPTSVTLTDVKNCLAGAGQAANITGATMFGAAGQSAVSTAAQAGYPGGDCYLVVSGGDALNWTTTGNVNAQPAAACQADPVFGSLCDVGGVTVSVFVPAGATKITFDYRFFEWDYVPFEDPFAATLYNPSGQPVASTGSQNSCEFVNKGGSDLALGNIRSVAFNVSAYQNQTVTIQFRASDRNDHVLDSGALINNLVVVSGSMPCAGAVCGGCANAANCAAINADGDAYNSCTDCDDSNAQVFPGASEKCNGKDDNCSGVADEGGVCCVDNDSDGYTGCNGDCNDSNPAVKPGAAEICDEIDNDCNGLIDFIGTQPVCAPPDDDGDGVNQNDDCDDSDASIYPGAPETCNFKDDDCDGVTDEGTCTVSCVTVTDGVNGFTAQDGLLSGDYPNYPYGVDFGAWTGVSSAGNQNTSLFSFNLAPLTAGLSETDSINVTSATFSVWVAWNPNFNQVTVHACNQPWSELTATANNYPTTNCDANALGSFNGGGLGFRSVDVKTLVGQWLDGTHANNGILLREPPVNAHYFYTKGPTVELQPKLDICYFVSH